MSTALTACCPACRGYVKLFWDNSGNDPGWRLVHHVRPDRRMIELNCVGSLTRYRGVGGKGTTS